MKSSITDARLGSKYASDKYASGSLFPYAESVIWGCSIYRKGALRDFTKFTGKYLCQRIFFNEVACLRPATSLKMSLWHRCFPVNFAKFLRTPFFTKHLWWLLLPILTIRLKMFSKILIFKVCLIIFLLIKFKI